MSKTKSFSLIISIMSIMAFATILSFQFVNNKTMQAALFGPDDSNQTISINIKPEDLILNQNNKSLTYNLYGTDSDNYYFLDYFSYTDSDDYTNKADDRNSKDYFHYYLQTATISSSGSARATLTSEFSLNNALKNAGINGYLNITPNASWDGNNDNTKVEVKFYAGETELYNSGSDYNIDNTVYLNAGSYAVNNTIYKLQFVSYISKYSWSNVNAYFRQPSITLTSTDIAAPTQSSNKDLFTFNTTGWTNSRTVTINVADSEAGLYKIVFKGKDKNSAGTEVANFTENTKDNSAQFTVTENGTYYIDVYDNVGNVATFEYVEDKIDVYDPEITITSLDEQNIANTTINLSTKDLQFNISAVDNSAVTIYYTTDGTTPTTESKTLINGLNNLTFTKGGPYTINIRVMDIYGNESSTTFSVTVPGDYIITQNLLDTSNLTTIFSNIGGIYGQNVSYTINSNIAVDGVNYLFYKAYLVNDEQETELFVENNSIEFPVLESATIRLDYRRVVNLTYTGLENNTPKFTLDVEGIDDLVSWTYTDNLGEVIENFENIDFVNANYKIDNEIYYGAGEVTLLNLDITDNKVTFIDEIDGQYNFDEYLTVTNSANFNNYTIEYQDAQGTVYNEENYKSCLPAGKYTYRITLNNAYVLNSNEASSIFTGEFEVLKKNLTLKVQEVTATYDGNAYVFNQDIGYKYNVEYLQNNEIVQPINAGNYLIKLTLDENNYTGTIEVGLSIQKRAITISITGGQNKYYQEQDPDTFTYEIISGTVVNDDNLGIVIKREEGENAGAYALFVDEELLNKNYNVTYIDEVFTILPLNVVLRIDAKTKIYGTDDPEFTYSTTSEIAEDLGIVYTRIAGENVGRYVISIQDWTNKNYSLSILSGALTIQPLSLEISINSATKFYGEDDPTFTYEIVSGEVVAEDDLGLNLTRQYGENVGEYSISLKSYSNKNYEISVVNNDAKLTINKTPITITANNLSKVYNTVDPILTWTADKEFKSTAFSGSLERVSGENAGQYEILQGSLSSDNYEITFVNGTFTIEKATLIVDIANLSKIYGENDPEYIYQIQNRPNNEVVNIILSREEGENAGSYKIFAEVDNTNYILSYQDAYLTIKKADALISVETSQFIYDGESKSINATLNCEGELEYMYYRNGEVVNSVVNAGDYSVIIRFNGNENYNATSKQFTFTIAKADAKIVVYRNVFVYSGSAFEPEIACNLPYRITFTDGASSNQIGEHDYILEICDEQGNVNANYNTFSGYVKIVEVPANQTSGGSVVFESGSVDNDNINLTLDEINDLQGAQNAVNGNVDKVYEIAYNQSSEAVVKVELDYEADDYSNVYVYAYNDQNEAKLLSYQIIDGKIVFSIDAENMKIAIVKQTAGISIVTLGILIVIGAIIAWIVISKTRKHKKANIIKIS